MIGKLNAGNLQKTTIFNIMEKQEQISMYEGVIKESNTLLKLYNSMLTYLNPDKEELKKISQRILQVVSIKDYSEQQLELLKNK
jgi:dihydrodipicolinate synthase/N-acetylneuraminate lyase